MMWLSSEAVSVLKFRRKVVKEDCAKEVKLLTLINHPPLQSKVSFRVQPEMPK